MYFWIAVLVIASCTDKTTRKVWLDDLDLSKVEQSAGVAMKNKSMWNTPLIIANDTFSRGVGTHALGVIKIQLDGKDNKFFAKVGIDASAPAKEFSKASVEFIIYGDGKVLWKSGIMKANDKAKPISENLNGVKIISLTIDNANDGIVGDRADWVDAYFEVVDKLPFTFQREHEKKYILTPETHKAPSINHPYIVGSHPSNPLLFLVPVSGERPMKIVAENLPKGLQIDENTGKIWGVINKQGEYFTKIIATNRFGSDQKLFKIIVGENIALTPPMGWNSWNAFGASVTQQKVMQAAKAMHESGLSQYGYSYINIDDGWQGKRGGKYNAIMPNEKFPDMKALVDYIHSLGLKAGIYSSPWVTTYAGYVGGSADNANGTILEKQRECGQFKFHNQDVKQWAEWGFDYLKYDWNPNDIEHTSDMTDALKLSGRNIVYSISNAAPFENATDWAKLTNAWRTTGDIQDTWLSILNIISLNDKWHSYAGAGHWNDPDMLVVGKLGWGGEFQETDLSPNEQYLHVTQWSMFAAPLFIGCDLSQLDDFTYKLLTNTEVIAINQDSLGIQGYRLVKDFEKQTEIWKKPLSNNEIAFSLVNLLDKDQEISLNWDECSLHDEYLIRDLWKQKNIGKFNRTFKTRVPLHGAVLIKLSN